jgi:hypothetical protein
MMVVAEWPLVDLLFRAFVAHEVQQDPKKACFSWMALSWLITYL